MRPMSVTRTLAVTASAALAATLLTGCTPTGAARATAQPAPTAEPSATEDPVDLPTVDWAPDTSEAPAEPEVPEGRTDRFRKDWVPGGVEPNLADWLWYAIEPPGHRRDIALRFAQALQEHDDFAAGLELEAGTRLDLQNVGDPQLHAWIADIRGHAGLNHAAPCTTARDLDADSAVVTCGALHVVVHLGDMVPGVVVRDWITHEDVFRGPHTHAFTMIDAVDL